MSLRTWMVEQLAMYVAYHRDRRNQATHHIGVPLIVFALLLASDQVPLFDAGVLHVRLAQLLLGALMLLYLVTLPLVGICACAFYAAVYALVLHVPDTLTWPLAGGAFVIGWIVQFVGHAFEGRRPALLVNARQVFMAPAFLIAEILFAAGLEQPLAGELKMRAAKYVRV